MVHVEKSFFYFGGYDDHKMSIISKFDSTTRQWSNLGKLLTDRRDHGVIFDGKYFIVVAGSYFRTETCELKGSSISCTHRSNQDLDDYQRYPELFLVPGDFCKKT